MSQEIIQVYIQKQGADFNSTTALFSAIRAYALGKDLSLPTDLVIEKNKSGKPYLIALPNLHFSLSHSGQFWFCAVADSSLGIDIQKHETCRMNLLAKRFFHQTEYSWLEENDYADFFSVWTAKESYVKYLGMGIDETFGDFSVVNDNGIKLNLDGVQLRFLPFYSGYSICICAADTSSVAIHWLK